MSVRRLDPVQPENFAFTAGNLAWARKTIAKYPPGKQASAVIPLLWRAQEQNDGWVSRPAIEHVAGLLGMSGIRVLEVATFYTMFQLSPVGRKAHVQVCGTTPCMLRGAEELKKVCQRTIHPEPHHLSADGDLSWEEVECLGACVNAPMVQVFKDTYEDLTPERLETIIADLAAGRKVRPGPQVERQFSAAAGGATTLTDPALYNGGRGRVPDAPIAEAKPAAEGAPVAAIGPVEPPPIKLAEPAPRPARVVEQGAPELLQKPRAGKGDDLKLIWGVGPKLEKILNKMGVWHFDQIAKWTTKDLSWVDERLEGFKGRAKRDGWIGQSKKLAAGWRPEGAGAGKPKKMR